MSGMTPEQRSMRARIAAGELGDVPEALALWNKVRRDGRYVVSKGLTARRALEIQLWKSGEVIA